VGGAIRSSKKRPTYSIPKALNQKLARAEFEAASPYMPGYSQAKDQLDMVSANAVQAASEVGNIQEMLPAIAAQQSSSELKLAEQNAMDQNRDEEILLAALSEMAAAQDQEFQMNEFAPFADAYNEGREMIGAGTTNLMSALIAGQLTGSASPNLGVNKKSSSSSLSNMAPLLRMMLLNAGGPIG
jgi:hypothetical protein